MLDVEAKGGETCAAPRCTSKCWSRRFVAAVLVSAAHEKGRRLKMSINFDLKTFFDHAAHGRLADVQRMLESGEVPVTVNGNLNEALVRAAENGHVDVVDYLLRHAMFDPSADYNHAIRIAAQNGHLAVVERLLHDERVDPSANDNYAVRQAARDGHLAIVDRLLQDKRVDPSASINDAVRGAARNGHLAVVERLMRDVRVDPSAEGNYAIRMAACFGHVSVVERLLQDKRVDPSARDNYVVRWAAASGHLAVVDRLLEDDRVDASVAIQYSRREDRKRFECRERLTEICFALQDLALPAWITVQILDAARPWSTLPLHSKWNLVCAVKHFHDTKSSAKLRRCFLQI
jgi:surface antigen